MVQAWGFEEGGACRRIQTKGQKTEFVRIGLAVRDRQNGKECAGGAMKGKCARGIRQRSENNYSSCRAGSRSSRAVVMEDNGCGFECECEGVKAERSGALNQWYYCTAGTKPGGHVIEELI
ncbi:hypothetical protein B0H13DRAFT_1899439 [Mycena leptocephala]|nr:hypothetical protein B0H13DRAFT_1899439 [Mycena leptocephala]